jgi:hypothetical protein
MTVKSFLFCGVSDAREFRLTYGREKGERRWGGKKVGFSAHGSC